MGLLKSIKKGFKNVFKGIGKVFKKGLAFVGKITQSKWGKILMLAATVFTGGMALAGGIAAFGTSAAAGGTFMTNFVAGAGGFMSALASPVSQAQKMLGGGATALETSTAITAIGQAAAPVEALQGVTAAGQTVGTGIAGAGEAIKAAGGITSTLPGQATGVAGAGLGGGGGTTALDIAGKTAATGGSKGVASLQGVKTGLQQGAQEGNWLTKAIKAGTDFAKTPAGAKMLEQFGKAGYEEAEMDKYMNFMDRYRRAWQNPDNPIQQMLAQEGSFDIDVPQGYLGRRVQNPATIRSGFEPTIPFSRGG